MTVLGPVEGSVKHAAAVLAAFTRGVVRAPIALARLVAVAPVAAAARVGRRRKGKPPPTVPGGPIGGRPGTARDGSGADPVRWWERITGLILRWRNPRRFGGGGGPVWDGGGGQVWPPLPPPPPDDGEGGTPGGGGASQSGSRERPPDEAYLESLRRGGYVRLGGAFLALSYVRDRGIDTVMSHAFASGKVRAPGLLHVTLDELLRVAVGARRRRRARARRSLAILRRIPAVARRTPKPAPPVLDPRFDVVLSRRGPVELDHDDEDRDARRTREANRPSGGVQGNLDVPRLEADSPMFDGAAVLARQGRSWIGERMPPGMSSARRARRVRALLRQRTHVRLEDDDVLHVRFRRPIRAGAGRELDALLTSLNARPAHTVGWMSFPMRFATRSRWRREP